MRNLATVLLLALTACTHTGPGKTENATVVDLIYQPPTNGTGVGVSMNGSVHVTSVDTDAAYGIVFQCPHGNFAVHGGDGSHVKDVWKAIKKGDRVRISYADLLDSHDTVVGYEFRDAVTIK